MPGKIGPIAVFGIIAAGGTGIILGGLGGNGEGEPAPGPVASIVQMKEAEIAERAVVSPGGKTIRMIDTGVPEKDATVTDTPIGRAVVIERVPEKALCHILFEADLRDQDKPTTPELDSYWGNPSFPVLLDDSCDGKKCIFAVMAQGEACKVIADSKYYVASSMEEILALPRSKYKRMLKTHGTCKGENGGSDYICNVGIDDPRANADAPWWVPHGWAGRDADFNFEQAKNGKAVDKYKVDETGEVKEVNPEGKDGESKPVNPEEAAEPVNP